MKSLIYLPDGNAFYFDIDTTELQGDAFAWYWIIIWLESILRISIDLIKNDLTLKTTKRWKYPASTMTDIEHTHGILASHKTPAKSKSLLHSIEEEERVISVIVNANKSDFMSSIQKVTIFISNKISWPIHIPQQQYLICWKWCQNIPREIVD